MPSVLWRCWLGGRKGIRPVKNWVVRCSAWLSVWSEVQTCICSSWCHCHSLSLASVKSRLVLPFWYRLNWAVPEKWPLNGCVCVCILLNTTIHSRIPWSMIRRELGRWNGRCWLPRQQHIPLRSPTHTSRSLSTCTWHVTNITCQWLSIPFSVLLMSVRQQQWQPKMWLQKSQRFTFWGNHPILKQFQKQTSNTVTVVWVVVLRTVVKLHSLNIPILQYYFSQLW